MEDGIARSPGHCMTMGTASTMTSAAEALGLTLPGAASIPAPDSRHAQMATLTGKRIVDMVWEDLKPSDILTAASFDNAVTTVLALGGSTNSIVHLIAMARRAGIDLDIARFDALARKTPVLANLRPERQVPDGRFLLRGRPARLPHAAGRPDRLSQQRTCNGRTLGENVEGAKVFNADVIRPRTTRWWRATAWPCSTAISRPAAPSSSPRRWSRSCASTSGPAVVFKDYDDMAARIDDDALPVTKDSVIVLQSAGPQGAPGMPEWGQLPIPRSC